MKPVLERILQNVEILDNGCWRWTRSVTPAGYGQMTMAGPAGKRVTRVVHKVLYEALVGPVPEGLQLDHTCHNADLDCNGGSSCEHRRCVNPAHLEPVTNRENTLRGRCAESNRERLTLVEKCSAGHPLSGPNLRPGAKGAEACRACARLKTRKHAGLGARGPRRRVVARSGRTVFMECGHSKTLRPNKPSDYALCPTCDAELIGGAA